MCTKIRDCHPTYRWAARTTKLFPPPYLSIFIERDRRGGKKQPQRKAIMEIKGEQTRLREEINWAYWIALQCGMGPAIGVAMPGVGKTTIHDMVAQDTGRTLLAFEMAGQLPEDAGGYGRVCDDEEGGHALEKVLDIRIKQAYRGKHILLLDEINQGSPFTQAAWQQRILHLSRNSETWVGGCMNPPEIATMGRVLPPAVVNRCWIGQWESDEDVFFDGIQNGCSFTTPEVPIRNENWKSYVRPMGQSVARFLRSRPDFLPTDEALFGTEYRREIQARMKNDGSPFPSPRSWEYAIHTLAGAYDMCASTVTINKLLDGTVGVSAREAYLAHEKSLNIQDAERLIAGEPLSMPVHGDLRLTLLQRVQQALKGDCTPDRCESCMDIIEQMWSQGGAEFCVDAYHRFNLVRRSALDGYVPVLRAEGTPVNEIERAIGRVPAGAGK